MLRVSFFISFLGWILFCSKVGFQRKGTSSEVAGIQHMFMHQSWRVGVKLRTSHEILKTLDGLLQRPSSRTTPSGSRRWRRVPSDTESDGFDNLDSLYGESESNISYGGYRLFNGESDAISFSAYGGDSDASLNLQKQRRIHSPEFLGAIPWRLREGRQTFISNFFSNLDESEVLPYFGNSEDYLDARGFEEFLEHLAETDSSRRGAPPAAVSFVNSLPRVVINEEHEKRDGLSEMALTERVDVGDGFFLLLLLLPVLLAWLLCCGYAFRPNSTALALAYLTKGRTGAGGGGPFSKQIDELSAFFCSFSFRAYLLSNLYQFLRVFDQT
ncbi:unnamed protein product, partial [Vitis vinifera]